VPATGLAGAVVSTMWRCVILTTTCTNDRTGQLFSSLVGARSGIIRRVNLIEPDDGEPALFHVGAQVANTHPHWGDHRGLSVGGCGLTKQHALMAALCEGVERYAGSSYNPAGKTQTQAQLECPSLSADRFVRFSEKQKKESTFVYVLPDRETPMRWVRGQSLGSDDPVAAPAFAVYVLYETARGEPSIGPSLSTGLACGDTIKQALEHALCEVIERDAVALHWLGGVAPPRVDDQILEEHAGDVLPPYDRVVAYDLTTDLQVPVMMVLCQGQGVTGSLLSVGSACHRNPYRALRKAAMEASQTRKYVELEIRAQPDFQPRPDFSNVSDFALHARLYCGRPNLAAYATAFVDGNDRPAPSFKGAASMQADKESDGALAELTHAVSQRQLDGAWFNLTAPWAAALDLHVVRVLIPELMPLHGHHSYAQLGHQRLADLDQALPHGVRRQQKIWAYPHPFP